MDRLPDTLAKAKGELLGDTSKYVEADTLVDTPDYNLIEAEVQELGFILKDVKFQAMGRLHSRQE